MNYARVISNKVAEVLSIEGNPEDHFHPDIVETIHELPEDSPVKAGYLFDGNDFHEPPPVVVPKPTTMTPLTFQARFHSEELTTIAQTAMSQPAIFLYMLQMASAQIVDLTDPRTIGGIQALAAAHLLTSDRAAAILTP